MLHIIYVCADAIMYIYYCSVLLNTGGTFRSSLFQHLINEAPKGRSHQESHWQSELEIQGRWAIAQGELDLALSAFVCFRRS